LLIKNKTVKNEIDWDTVNSKSNYKNNGYAISKLANVLFTNELARRVSGTDVSVVR